VQDVAWRLGKFNPLAEANPSPGKEYGIENTVVSRNEVIHRQESERKFTGVRSVVSAAKTAPFGAHQHKIDIDQIITSPPWPPVVSLVFACSLLVAK